MMTFIDMPTAGLVNVTTPLQSLPRFSSAAGGAAIHIKRDDLLPWGGNKARKLDYLLYEAKASGANAIVTASTVQCNHNLMSALAAARLGMECALVLESWADPSYTFEADPLRQSYEFAGVAHHISTDAAPKLPVDGMPEARELYDMLISEGKHPYYISRGGAGPLGACGYVACAYELVRQLDGAACAGIVCPSGIGGTQAGLIVGLKLAGANIPVYGISVNRERSGMEAAILAQSQELSEFLHTGISITADDVVSYDDFVGSGYGRPTPAVREAISLLARSEGIMTDPTYSGKTLAGLIGLQRAGVFSPGDNVIYLHTGGLTPYYSYASIEHMEG